MVVLIMRGYNIQEVGGGGIPKGSATAPREQYLLQYRGATVPLEQYRAWLMPSACASFSGKNDRQARHHNWATQRGCVWQRGTIVGLDLGSSRTTRARCGSLTAA
jgi:hypothetical protein